MHDPTVYSILQSQKGNKQVARLLDALDELAGRLESVGGFEIVPQPVNTTQASSGRRTGVTGRLQHGDKQDFQSLQLPDPQAGLLPLFTGASEFDALQSAAQHTSSQLPSKAERQAWRSWLMRPSHFVRVVEAAWLLLSLVFKQDDPCAAALQAYAFGQLAHHYVSEVLAGQAAVENAAGLWAQALAEAACQLLRAAFPSVAELQDSQVQQVLHRQLRLWTTGLLPSDAGADGILQAASQPSASPDHDFGEVDLDQQTAVRTRATKAATSRCTAPFVSVKPGPLVSAFMADNGIRPTALLQANGPKLKSLTVPQQQLQQLQQTLDQQPQHQLRQEPYHSRRQQQQRQTLDLLERKNVLQAVASTAGMQQVTNQTVSSTSSTAPVRTAAAGTPSRMVQAAACVAAAAAASEQYRQTKKAGAVAASRSTSVLHQQMRQLQVKRGQMLRAGHEQVQVASNQIAGWLSEPSSASACVSAATTDAQCKAQRQLMEGHLRLGDWRMAHAFNATVHGKCLDMAASVAVLSRAPTADEPTSINSANGGMTGSGNSSSSGQRYDRPGGGWADIAGCSLVSTRVQDVRSGAGTGSSVKITKAARAIVEDVQRKFAATPSSPPRRK